MFLNASIRDRLQLLLEEDLKHFDINTKHISRHLIENALQLIQLHHVDKIFFPKHDDLNEVYENHMFALYILSTIIKVILQSIVQLHDISQSIDTLFQDLPTILSLNEVQKNAISDFLNKVFILYNKRKSLSLVTKTKLNNHYEIMRDKKKKSKKLALNKMENDERNMFLYLRDNGIEDISEFGFNEEFDDLNQNTSQFEENMGDQSYKDVYQGLYTKEDIVGYNQEGYDISFPNEDE